MQYSRLLWLPNNGACFYARLTMVSERIYNNNSPEYRDSNGLSQAVVELSWEASLSRPGQAALEQQYQ